MMSKNMIKSKKPSSMFRRTVDEIMTIKGAKKIEGDGNWAVFKTPYFYIYVYDKDYDKKLSDNFETVIRMGEIKAFNKWGDSTNFKTRRSRVRRHYYAEFIPQYLWAIKVLKSKLFNFNKYFHTIELPWINPKRNT